MDFQAIKKKVLDFKDYTVDKSQEAIEYSARKLASSKWMLKSHEEYSAFVASSKNKVFQDPITQVEKKFEKKVIVLFVDLTTPFFQHMLLLFPVLSTKAFSQNIWFRLADARIIEKIAPEILTLDQAPALLVFENELCTKKVFGKENIEKVVKSLSLDINKTIETLV